MRLSLCGGEAHFRAAGLAKKCSEPLYGRSRRACAKKCGVAHFRSARLAKNVASLCMAEATELAKKCSERCMAEVEGLVRKSAACLCL